MARKNKKTTIINYDNNIKKSNELSMAKLNQGLSLNQMQLFAYAIFSTQQSGVTEFRKHEFQDKFGIKSYKTEDAYEDSDKVSALRFSTEDLENNKFSFTNVFSSIDYEDGIFNFEWNRKMIPHILELKTYSLIDLTIVSNFKSGFSWTLYEYLKGHYGNWHKKLSKEALMNLFGVENRATYNKNTNRFKHSVLDVAIKEVNVHTELNVWYTENKTGNKITSFILHWSTGKQLAGATEKQIKLLKDIHEEVERNMFDYLSVKDIETARNYIIKIKEFNIQLNKGISITEADESIKELLNYYKQLEHLVEMDGKQRDTSIYYNWLEEK